MAELENGAAGLHAAEAHLTPPDFDSAGEFGADVNGATPPEVTENEAEAAGPSNKVYFIRIPRPPFNDEELKKLQAQFQEQVAKLKVHNAKLATKREELRELRRQMGVAKGLKDGSKPEYEEKLNRLKELRDQRNKYTSQMASIKENLRGLDCKSEEELEAKIKQLEDRIVHEGLLLREEKQVVQQISKLQQQRTLVRDYDNQKGSLTELEQESARIKAEIADLESEFSILKTERDQAVGIMNEIWSKVQAAEAEIKELMDDQAELTKAKDDVLAALDRVRSETNESMSDYRENRTFSLRVRDMIAAGQVDEARAECAAQVDAYMARYASDGEFRKEYNALWAAQRKFPVSELLPESSNAAKEARAADSARSGAAGGAGNARAAKAKPAAPAKPQGAEKAKALIEALMAQAQEESQRKPRRISDDADDADDEDEPAAPAPAAAVVAASVIPREIIPPSKPSKPAASLKPADVLKQVELPKISDEEFVSPVVKPDPASAVVDKEQLREEQMRKAAEAEARKRRLAEQKEKKKREAEVKKRAEEERKRAEALAALQGKSAPRAAPKPAAEEQPEQEESTSDNDAAVSAPGAASGVVSRSAGGAAAKPASLPVVKSQATSAAKRPKGSETLPKKLKKFVKQNAVLLAVSGLIVLIAILLYFSAASS